MHRKCDHQHPVQIIDVYICAMMATKCNVRTLQGIKYSLLINKMYMYSRGINPGKSMPGPIGVYKHCLVCRKEQVHTYSGVETSRPAKIHISSSLVPSKARSCIS